MHNQREEAFSVRGFGLVSETNLLRHSWIVKLYFLDSLFPVHYGSGLGICHQAFPCLILLCLAVAEDNHQN